MTSAQIRSLHCSFREFHCFPDGEGESKGISRVVSHLKTLHLWTDEYKNTIRKSISSDPYLFTIFKEILRGFGSWICRRCMSIHAMSWICYHPDGLIWVTHGSREVKSHIMVIVKPSTIESNNLDANEGIVLGSRLLE